MRAKQPTDTDKKHKCQSRGVQNKIIHKKAACVIIKGGGGGGALLVVVEVD